MGASPSTTSKSECAANTGFGTLEGLGALGELATGVPGTIISCGQRLQPTVRPAA
jgi:hypothetical protein